MPYSMQHVFTAPGGIATRFGQAVSLSADGNKALITAPHYDTTLVNVGAAHVFTRTGGAWSIGQTITESAFSASQKLGIGGVISADGLYVALLANTTPRKGYVYFFDGGQWVSQGALSASTGVSLAADAGRTQIAISADGTTIVIGALGDSHIGSNMGAAYVFVRSGVTWTEQAILAESAAVVNNQLGCSVAISADGNTIAAGVANSTYAGHAGAGAVCIFTRAGTTWAEQQTVHAADPTDYAEFGGAVSLSGAAGDYLSVGAIGADAFVGAHYVFHRVGAVWTQQGKLSTSPSTGNDELGRSVGINAAGGIIVAGAPYSGDPDETPGIASVATRTDVTWSEAQQLTAIDFPAFRTFGAAVAISADGGTILVADDYERSSAEVYAFVAASSIELTGAVTLGAVSCTATLFSDSVAAGHNGTATTDITGTYEASACTAVAVQPDGKIVAAGATSTETGAAIVRYMADGVRDLSFGDNGIVVLSTSPDNFNVNSIAIQADGKIVFSGYRREGGPLVLFIGRRNTDGTPDLSFNGTGISSYPLPSVEAPTDSLCAAVVIQDDGAIVAAGTIFPAGDCAVIRVTTDGTLDPTFATGGVAIFSPPALGASIVYGLGIAPDGGIIVSSTSGGGATFVLAKLTAAGLVDTSFSSDGFFTLSFTVNAAPIVFAMQPDGRIVVAVHHSSNRVRVYRFTTTGGVDIGFGTSGYTEVYKATDANSFPYAVSILSNGKILIAGYSIAVTSGTESARVARLTATGVLDTSFGQTGIVDISPGDTFVYPGVPDWKIARAFAMAVRPDESYYVLGGYIKRGNYAGVAIQEYFSVFQLAANGAHDTVFGADDHGIICNVSTDPLNVAAYLALPIELYGYTTLAFMQSSASFTAFVPPEITGNITTAAATSVAMFYANAPAITAAVLLGELDVAGNFALVRNVYASIVLDPLYSTALLGAGTAVSMAAVLDPLTCDAYFTRSAFIQADAVLGGLICDAQFLRVLSLQAAIELAPATTVAEFIPSVTVSADIVTGELSCAAVFLQPRVLSADVSLSALTSVAELVSPSTVIGAVTTDLLTAVATLQCPNVIQSAAVLSPLTTFAVFASTEFDLTPTVLFYPDHDAFTEYRGFGFNSYARIGATYFAAKDDGLFSLSGDDDNGAPIAAHVLTGMLDFGEHTMTRVPRAYFDFSGDAGMVVSVYTSPDGLRRTEAFALGLLPAPSARSACLPLARGLASHFWQYRISNIDGGGLHLTRLALHPSVLTRSI